MIAVGGTVYDPETASWAYYGNCAKVEPEAMFPHRKDEAANAAAKAVCEGCPVMDLCIADHEKEGKNFGVWGGTTELEREAAIRNQRNARRREQRRAKRDEGAEK